MIKVKGLDEIHFNEDKLSKLIKSDIRGMVKKAIATSKTLKLYFADHTGLLRGSSINRLVKESGGVFNGALANKTFYSGFIHEGTYGKSGKNIITPRPWLLDSVMPEVPALGIKLGDSVVKSLISKKGIK